MNEMMNDLLATVLYAGLGMLLLGIGYLMLDLLTPGRLGHHVFVDHRRDAALVLGSSMLSLGGIIATAIYTAEEDTWHTLAETASFGLLGVGLLGVAFMALDAITPGKLGDLVCDESEDPAVWVIVATQIAVGLIVIAALT